VFRRNLMKCVGKMLAGLTLALAIPAGSLISCAGPEFASQYDVIVIGAGGAGLSAAVSAKEAGADVVIFEKMDYAGGNTLRATGGINAAGTSFQEKAGIMDNPDLFYEDTMKGGYNKNNPELVRNLAEKSASSVDWLTRMGVDLSDVGRLAGASVNRAHRPTGGGMVGPSIIAGLNNQTEKVLGIPVYTGTRVIALISEKGRITGVKVAAKDGKQYNVHAKAVVLAAGGFGANNEMVAALVPSLKGFSTTNHAGATGDGIDLAEKAGAALVDMTEIQTHPTYVEGKEMITEAVRGNGAILVNKQGSRFVNELKTRDVVSAAILDQEGQSAFLVFDDSVRKSLKAIENYIRLKIVVEAASPEALASAIGADPGTLTSTVAAYNEAVASTNDPAFGRTDMPRALATPPYYAINVVPAVHHTMGGVKIDTQARVISTAGSPIPGFYAAGEVTGGVHGGNRLGGNALADITTYGRIAGANAAAAARAAQGGAQPKGASGAATASAQGFGGTVTVTITMEKGKITGVEAAGPDETLGIGSRAIDTLPGIIKSAGALDGIEMVSGASFSSAAVLSAAREAVAKIQAGN
jgi:fumarate reductase flavoprotein subunit